MGRSRREAIRLAALALAVALPGGIADADDRFHTNPACWQAPRLHHAGPPPDDLADRVRLIEMPAAPVAGGETVSPNGAYRFWVRNPDIGAPPPWDAEIVVERERPAHLVLRIENVAQPVAPRWINEKLILLRVAWGRVVFSDLIVDVERGGIIFHEQVHDGTAAWQQFRQACGGACPCPGVDAIVGLVLLPTVFGPPEQGGIVPSPNPIPVPVYDAPREDARRLGELTGIDDVDYREYTYEGAAAVVYETAPGWYRIGLAKPLAGGRPTAWVPAESTGGFLGLSDLLVGAHAYLNEFWDGYVWTVPVAGTRSGPSPLDRDADARVLDVRKVGGGTWLRIETLRGLCTDAVPAVVDRGWIPAYGVGGRLVAWFRSRGC